MSGNTLGTAFRIHSFGESHGPAIGVVIDGCPAGLSIDYELIQKDLFRRRPGQSAITTQRKETEQFEILSGVFEGKTTGTPIAILIPNKDARSKDYSHIKDQFRPSHADFTYTKKYGHRDYRGGGRSSARETATRVAAGAVAKMLLSQAGININAFVSQVGHIKINPDYNTFDIAKAEENIVRCPDAETANKMIDYIAQIKKEGDTVGGKITGVITGCPVGLGEPVFNKLHAALGQAMLSINAVKGFEYGSGFSSIEMRGSEHNDRFKSESGKVITESNYSGGIQGGISNGMDIYFNVAFKPVATIMRDQKSVNKEGEETDVKGKGRHDPCVVPRAVPIVEAMAALVITDYYLLSKINKLD